jgi:type IV secretion system protein VirB4
VIQKDGILQRSFAYQAPDVDSSGAEEINGLCVRVNDFAKRLGSGWAFFVEAQRFYTREYPAAAGSGQAGFDTLAGYLVDKERQAVFSAAGKHFETSYFLTFAWRPPLEGVKKLTGMFIQSGAEGGGAKHVRENVDQFVGETDAIIGLLSQNLVIVPLSNEETVAYLHSSVSLKRHRIAFPHTQLFLDRVLPDSELENTLTMRLGGRYIPIIGVNDFPEDTYPAILDALNRARLEYRWVSRYLCMDKEDQKKEARKKEKAHRGNRKTFLQTFAESTSGSSGSGVINHGAGVLESDSIDAGVEIETDQAALGYLSSGVMVWDADYKQAKRKAEIVRNIINSAGFTCKEETWNALEAWKAMMPGQVYANYRALPVMSYNLSHVLPLSSVWAGMRRNEHAGHITGVDTPHIVCSTAEGTPFFLNINPTDVGHTAVWGPTGAGKSTLLNLLEVQFFKYPGSQVIVFDKGRSCRQICLASGGLFYEPAAENAAGISFQPLRDLETDRDMMDAMDFIESLCLVSAKDYEVTPPMRTAVKEALDLLRDKGPEARTITSFVHYVNYLDPKTGRPVFKEMLADYLWDGGKFGKIFDSRSSGLSLDTRFLAIEMEDLMNRRDGCIVPALVYLFNLVEKMFDGRLSLLVLDEAWLFLKNEIFAGKIAEWLKVLRKKNVFVVFATQEVADVEKSPLKTTIIQQCLTKIYLADPSASTAGMIDVYRAFGLSDPEITLITASRMKRDYFYTSPLGRRLFQLSLGPLTLALIGSPDHGLLDELVREQGAGVPLCAGILERKRIDYRPYLDHGAPADKPAPRKDPRLQAPVHAISAPPAALPPLPVTSPAGSAAAGRVPAAAILDAVAALQDRSRKGSGRAAETLARDLGVSQSTVYQARRILRRGGELLERVRRGELTIKKAYTSLQAGAG